MGEFKQVSAGSDLAPLLLNSRWVNGVTQLLDASAGGAPEVPGKRGAIIDVIVTETLPAAAWDPVTKKRTPRWVSVCQMYRLADGSETFSADVKIRCYHKFARSVAVGAGKGRFGYVQDRRLTAVDCEEVEIGEAA